ncbi:hypothetical protein EG703_04735 [Salmonella enterica]|nr:hypothetical protein [Salmonella enterica]
MQNDLGLGFICKSARTSTKVISRKVTFPLNDSDTAKLTLTGLQCHPSCRFPFYQLSMLIHNQLSDHDVNVLDENAPFTISINIHEWLSRARVAFIDYHGLRNTEKTAMITLGHLEELLTHLSTTLAVYIPYSKKRLNFSFLTSFTLIKTSQSYTLTFPGVLRPILALLGGLIQEFMTEKLLKRRSAQFVIFEYLRNSRSHSHKITDIANALQLQTVNVRIMNVLTQLADQGLISFICDGKRGERSIEELQFIPYASRDHSEVLSFEEWITPID